MLTLVVLVTTSVAVCAQNLTEYVANTYTGTLTVTTDNGEYTHKNIVMDVEKCNDGTVNLKIRDFKLIQNGEVKPIGNITVNGVQLAYSADPSTVEAYVTKDITIENGTMPEKEEGGDPDDEELNSATGDNQEAEGAWGDDDEGDDVNTGQQTPDKEWFGPSYGIISLDMNGKMSQTSISLSINVYVPSQDKYVTASFTYGNVSTDIDRTYATDNSQVMTYTISGIPASKSYKGVVIKGKKTINN